MSLSSALNVALSGLQTSTAQLQLTSDNISNANTPGYTEQSANLSSTAEGNVEIASYTNASDKILTQSLNAATASASYYSAQNGYMTQVQSILGSTSSNPPLSSAIAQFQAAWTQLQTSPEDATVQAAVVDAGTNLAQQINSISGQVITLQAQVVSDTQSTVNELNTDLANIATLNGQIVTATSQNQPTGALEDERNAAINQIASITNVSVFQRNEGQIALYTPDGVALVDGNPQTFSYNSTTGVITNSGGINVTSDLSGGSLQAQLQFNATATTPSSTPGVNTIQKLQNQINDLISAFTTNSAGPPATFANAYNPNNTAGDDFFTNTSGFAVNSTLVSDPTTLSNLTSDEVNNTANSFASTYNFTDTGAGLSLNSGTTTNLVTTILSGFQQAANTISTQSQSATQQQKYYQQSLTNATGVNVDSELVNLTTLQNSYAASAHVISTISEMFNDLMATI
jgi:flagellar hook-associated protein 1 FlgK